MKIKSIIVTSLLAIPMAASAQIVLTDADLSGAYQSKSYAKRISCHDPSIVRDGSKYYIYGSHMGRGYTTLSDSYRAWSNYSSWPDCNTDEGSDASAKSMFTNSKGNRINFASAYNTPVVTQYKDCNGKTQTLSFNAHSWQYTGNTVAGMQWAPDIIYNTTMKKWCMYMSLNGDYWCSSIVLFTSDSAQGPWTYQGPVVCSGFGNGFKHVGFEAIDDWKKTDFAIATGETTLPARYDVVSTGANYGGVWPNCIDPCVFYDENGKLWMSYGSWSGGIFIFELDETTGLRDYTVKYPYQVNGTTVTTGAPNQGCTSDPYFGKKIAGGYYVSGEASYIQHIGNYYYLFVTNGQLQATGTDYKGYQMRVYRSENPDGPYNDPNSLSALPGKYVMNYAKEANRDYGVKLFGNYKWDLMSSAEVCQGHNSAIIDEDGHSLLVNHVRTYGSEGHQVRVHQLFLTQDGWLVASPYEYSDENSVTDAQISSKALYKTEQICGDYQLMVHPYRQDTKNSAYATPVNITLNSDGTITGAYTGSWECPAGTSYINITLNKMFGSTVSPTFKGVLFEQTIDYSNVKALCFSVCGTSGTQILGNTTNASTYGTTMGLCIWGSKADYKGAIKCTLDKVNLPFTNGATVNSSLTLPTTGYLGAKVEWESSDANVMTSAGKVMGKGSVTLTMKILKDGYVYEKDYTLTVDADAEATVPVYYPESTTKNTTSGWWSNFSKSDYTLAQGKSMKFKFYNYSNKANNYDNWCLYGANATHGATGYTEYFGIRNDNWDNTTGSNTGCTSNFDWSTFLADMNGSLVDMTVDYTSAGVFTMTSTITTTAGKTYTYSYKKTLSAKPASINLFFVSEGSYIDGSSLSAGIDDITVDAKNVSDASYNINGQRVGNNYKGVVIKNGKKFIQK